MLYSIRHLFIRLLLSKRQVLKSAYKLDVNSNPALVQLHQQFEEEHYIATANILMAVFLCQQLQRPLLVEGPPGVGKTEIAKVMARILDTDLIRLQCYEGLGSEHAIYEWNYQRQLLALKMLEQENQSLNEKEALIFSEEYLLERPLLRALKSDQQSVLLIDEVDRADEAFESYLLEILSDWQVTIPELGTIKAKHIPFVVVTSNRMRDLSEALRRRCLYLWIDYPEYEKELAIVQRKVPDINEQLGEQICRFLQSLRQQKLDKAPGIAETLDWAQALTALHIEHLDKAIIEETLGIILKDWQDIRQTQLSLSELLDELGVVSKLS